MVGGGAVAAASEDSVAAAPAWRNAISDMTLSSSWDEAATPSEIQAVRQTVFDLIQPLREIGPPPAGGQYLNEASPYNISISLADGLFILYEA